MPFFTEGEVADCLHEHGSNLSDFNNDLGFISESLIKQQINTAVEGVVRQEDIQDVVRQNNIADVVRISEIQDVVRVTDIQDVAKQEDVTKLDKLVDVLEAKVKFIQAKIDYEPEVVADIIEQPLTIKDETKDIIVLSDFNSATEQTATIVCNSIALTSNRITNNKLSITAEKDIDIKNAVIGGTYTNNKGTIVSLNKADYITIKDLVIDPQTAYNGLEIGLGDCNIKSITIDNCKFDGTFKNNAISIFGTTNDAIINITNCTFNEVSNVLRLSNKLNSENVTINISNCVVNKWETTPAYSGMIICQDYTSGSYEKAIENNLFGGGKITINITNLKKPNGEILSVEDVATICGTADENQIIYVYAHNKVETDLQFYPTVVVG